MAERMKLDFRLFFFIAVPKLTHRAKEIYMEENVPITYNVTAHGTASSEIIDMLGLENNEKRALISMIPGSIHNQLLEKLRNRLYLGAPNTGIAFSVPLSGCSASMMRMMKKLNEEYDISLETEKEDEPMENEHVMLMAFVDEGYSEDVMAAARPAGAKGGTVFHSRVAGSEDTLKIWNIVVQQQREIVIILADKKNKVAIMQAISEKCGSDSPAHGMVVSLPVDDVAGIRM